VQRTRKNGAPLTTGVRALDGSCQKRRRMYFEILGPIHGVETFAIGPSIRDLPRLRRMYGRGRWRKRKGVATVRLPDGTLAAAELHWYEASGIGRREMRIKRLIR
jgi:hypothetical protein